MTYKIINDYKTYEPHIIRTIVDIKYFWGRSRDRVNLSKVIYAFYTSQDIAGKVEDLEIEQGIGPTYPKLKVIITI